MDWDRRFLDLAKHVAQWSKDPSTQCGAVFVRSDRTIASVGYNGFPKGIVDDHRLHDRETKYESIIHAEMNGMMNAKEPVAHCHLYVWPLLCCPRCAVHMIQAKVIHVTAPINLDASWDDRLSRSRKLFDEAQIGYSEI